ncbi:glycosylhydrolase-like jelly roll fold domain-containing protein [Paenibacillus lemnae]|uniref:Glycosyl hydrolases family 2 sugar binding domain-containing protein n=1 Tax=Paenibacillus lemnae TaxID=1330551 RepID=A0A848MF39_PAELE|nr:glycosylhydrolase-like jelly roll fold domain-containing protein [Paenibacillus lemnae]NMO98034.1 hypothetical protein [Paenibacillus lemnae]
MFELNTLRQQFIEPPAEFSPIPFWFWNDELTEDELIRQLRDFHSKEVNGVVIHPRMGLPDHIPYLSEAYMALVEAVVAEAEVLGMSIILYDEGMYPSGSACGLVVKQNADYASRGLQMREMPCETGTHSNFTVRLKPGEMLVSVQAVRKLAANVYDPDSTVILELVEHTVSFTPPDDEEWYILMFVDTPSKGSIRGVHPGQDDGEPGAPPAADLLNPDAVQAFLTITHETYYKHLSSYFGTTVIAMFTDEPDLLGRRHLKHLKPWTRGFMDEYLMSGGRERDLPALWLEGGELSASIRDHYEAVIRSRLGRTYYKPLADWCEHHGIALTGHPAGSDDIGLLEHFHIPGQDVVWRYVAPENGTSLTGVHSTMAKCSSDAARHRAKRRNLNECFGVCGVDGGWSLSADHMKWILDWLFVRGVNQIIPHAFYYSIRGERRDERPPDVGPHNIWWPEYARFSRYIKRMSWLMTDSVNHAEVAVLAGAACLPWNIVKPLYEGQVEFNYLEEVLLSSCTIKDGEIRIAGYRYKALLIEDSCRVSEDTWKHLVSFVEQGGLVLELFNPSSKSKNFGQIQLSTPDDVFSELMKVISRPVKLDPAAEHIRISHISKDNMYYYIIVNEGESGYTGKLQLEVEGRAEIWRPWDGDFIPATVLKSEEGLLLNIHIERRECVIVAVDPLESSEILDLSSGWLVVDGPCKGSLTSLSSWTKWAGMEHYSGTVTYEQRINIHDSNHAAGTVLDLGSVHEIMQLSVNGREQGVRMWAPYRYDIGQDLQQGENLLRVTVTNSLANRYDRNSLPSGLIGPVRLIRFFGSIS